MKKLLLILFIGLFTLVLASVGKIDKLSGNVSILRGTKNMQATLGQEVKIKDTINTKGAAKVTLRFKDNTIIHLGKNAVFSVEDYLFEDNKKPVAEFNMLSGTFKAISGRIGKVAPERFTLKTKTATIGIRGTIIIGSVTPQGDNIACSKGAISVKTPFGTVVFKAGNFTQVKPGKAPTKPAAFTATFKEEVDQATAAPVQDGEAPGVENTGQENTTNTNDDNQAGDNGNTGETNGGDTSEEWNTTPLEPEDTNTNPSGTTGTNTAEATASTVGTEAANNDKTDTVVNPPSLLELKSVVDSALSRAETAITEATEATIALNEALTIAQANPTPENIAAVESAQGASTAASTVASTAAESLGDAMNSFLTAAEAAVEDVIIDENELINIATVIGETRNASSLASTASINSESITDGIIASEYSSVAVKATIADEATIAANNAVASAYSAAEVAQATPTIANLQTAQAAQLSANDAKTQAILTGEDLDYAIVDLVAKAQAASESVDISSFDASNISSIDATDSTTDAIANLESVTDGIIATKFTELEVLRAQTETLVTPFTEVVSTADTIEQIAITNPTLKNIALAEEAQGELFTQTTSTSNTITSLESALDFINQAATILDEDIDTSLASISLSNISELASQASGISSSLLNSLEDIQANRSTTLTGHGMSIADDDLTPSNNTINQKAIVPISNTEITQTEFDYPLFNRRGSKDSWMKVNDVELIGGTTLAMVSEESMNIDDDGMFHNQLNSITLYLQNTTDGTLQNFTLDTGKESSYGTEMDGYFFGSWIWDPKLAILDNDKLAIAWQYEEFSGYSQYFGEFETYDYDREWLYVNIYGLDGTSVGEKIEIDFYDSIDGEDNWIDSTDVAKVKTDKALVGWTRRNEGLYGTIVDKDGTILDNKKMLISADNIITYDGYSKAPKVALSEMGDNNFVAQVIGNNGLYASVFNIGTNNLITSTVATGLALTPGEYIVDHSVVGLDDNKFAYAFISDSLYTNYYDMLNNGMGIQKQVDTIDYMTSSLSLTNLGMNKYILSWNNNNLLYASIYQLPELYDEELTTILDKTLIASDNFTSQASILALSDSKFIVNWNTYTNNSSDFVESYSDVLNSKYYNIQVDNSIVSSDTYTFGTNTFDGKYQYFDKADNTLAYTLTLVDSSLLEGVYDIYSDNLKQFIVGTADDYFDVNGNIINTSVDSVNHYTDMFYAGIENDGSTLVNDKLYIYGNAAELNAPNYSDSIELDPYTSPTDIVALNGNLKTIAFIPQPIDYSQEAYNEDFHGAHEFFSMRIGNYGNIDGKSLYTSNNYFTGEKEISNGMVEHGQLYGDEFQGIGVTMSGTTQIINALDLSTIESYSEESIHALYLQSVLNLAAKTGSVTLSGYSMGVVLTSEGGLFSNDGTLSLTMDRNTGSISGSVQTEGMSETFLGTLAEYTSNYISDDNFAVMANNAVVISDDSFTYIPESGFLVSRPDTFDGSVAHENNDDYSSWGYWTGVVTDGNIATVVDARNAWIAGEYTNATDMADLITKAGSSTPAYYGHVLGSVVRDGVIETIRMDHSNNVQLNFDLGAQSVAGNISFATDNTSWNETIENSSVTPTNFGFNTTNGVGTGTFFGPNVDSVGGTFTATDNLNTAKAVFKAGKTDSLMQGGLLIAP